MLLLVGAIQENPPKLAHTFMITPPCVNQYLCVFYDNQYLCVFFYHGA
jgi:hypothetical protein